MVAIAPLGLLRAPTNRDIDRAGVVRNPVGIGRHGFFPGTEGGMIGGAQAIRSLTPAEGDHPDHPERHPALWELSFRDEFDSPTLDPQKWRSRFRWGRDRSSVGELQWYAPDDFEQTDPFVFTDGRMRIVADRCAAPTREGHRYCSGLVSSHASFAQEYGYFEIRLRAPAGQGLWPAFWLLPVDGSNHWEIDVLEILGHEPDVVHMFVHFPNGRGNHAARGRAFRGPDFSREFHTFAVDWNPHRIVWYVDGEERHRFEQDGAIPRGRFYLIANLAVGGDWPGSPDETTPFPAALDIDYIRVYRRT